MDGNTGTVLKILEERGLKDNTIVIFMGDNGASQYRGKGTLNELGIHVPLIVRWPGVVKAGTSSKGLVSGEDLAPTILQIANINAPKNLTGVELPRRAQGSVGEVEAHADDCRARPACVGLAVGRG